MFVFAFRGMSTDLQHCLPSNFFPQFFLFILRYIEKTNIVRYYMGHCSVRLFILMARRTRMKIHRPQPYESIQRI